MTALFRDWNGLARLSWAAKAGATVRLSCQALVTSTWTIGRAWSAGLALDSVALPNGMKRVLIGAEGNMTLQLAHDSVTLSRQQLLILDAQDSIRVSSAEPWARFEWIVQAAALGLQRHEPGHGRSLEISQAHWELIAAISNSLINTEMSLESPGLTMIGGVLSQTITAALADQLNPQGDGARPIHPLLLSARRLIAENYANPSYSVEDLRNDLSISKTHLHRLFATAGTSPRRDLERRRVMAAQEMIHALSATRPSDLAEIATAAGFSSRERMQRALLRWETDQGQ